VSFGRPFITNPDLVERLRSGTPLVDAPNETDQEFEEEEEAGAR
jgi:2,4-dienoyl-CoA reductase-like NADH-dependent reductase (Old Yellow Enzyme family)